MGKVRSVRLYDSRSGINWRCGKCGFKFGEIADEKGLVKCIKCGNTNNAYSQYQILSKRGEYKKMTTFKDEKPKRILSGIRPTGKIHLGNYLGAIKQFKELQEDQNNECFFFVADLHALTTLNKPIDIDKKSIDVVRTYLACGIDEEKSLIYRQSDIPEIPYFATLLGMITPEALLRRCTTFKDKAAKQETVSLGLLSYPVLMAADILIINADTIPVGEDQLQHLEIVRDIAIKFNNIFGEVLTLPKARAMNAIRVPGLDGTGKMGKSDNNTIDVVEDAKSIKKKVMSATTDLGPTKGQEMSPPMKNLYYLLELCSTPEIYNMYKDMYERGEQRFYGELKQQLANDIIELLAPIRERFHSPACSEEKVRFILYENRERVSPIARRVLKSVQSNLGFHLLVSEKS